MALIDDGEPKYVFHVSTGAPATPSDRGKFTLLLEGPRLQLDRDVLLGLLQPRRGDPRLPDVPTYNASHGCIRNPIPDSVFIYNWIDLGDTMYVYD